MADFTGSYLGLPLRAPIHNAQPINLPAPATVYRGLAVPSTPSIAGVFEVTGDSVRGAFTDSAGYASLGAGRYWFEHVHSVPLAIELGNIVTTVLSSIEIYNAYHLASRELQAAVNGAGSGTTLLGLPALPYDIAAQHSLIVQLQVSTSGPPLIDGTLVFTLDTGDLVIPVTGSRVVMFPFVPEAPIGEELEFRTTILRAIDGKEQRVALRRCPRQALSMLFAVEDDAIRRSMHSLLFGWGAGVFGVPIWFEARQLDAPAAISDLTIQVDTRYGDFRDGSLAIVWSDESTYDALEIASHTDSSLTFSSPLTHAHQVAGAWVIPLRTALADADISGTRSLVNFEQLAVVFRVLDNDVPSIADVSAFPTYNGKVVLDEANYVDGDTFSRSISRVIGRHDNGVAPIAQFSDVLAPSTPTQKGFLCLTAQRRWEVRQLLHALRGPQTSFYLPTMFHDLVPAGAMTSGASTMDIENIGYSRYIDGQAPANHIRIELLDGSVVYKEILSSVVLSDTVERLTMSDTWAATIQPEDVLRISYLSLARIAEDTVSLVHGAAGDTTVIVPVLEVQQ